MAIAWFKDLCIDSTGSEDLGPFWAAALGLVFEPGDEGPAEGSGSLAGPHPQHRIWINTVPEAKSVKHRIHLDVHTDSVDTLVQLGATVLQRRERWTVMADPEGGEFCAFEREEVPDYRLYEVVVDCADPGAQAQWWSEVLDAPVHRDPEHGWWLEPVPGAPFECLVFDAVPEPKTVKNRIHWDLEAQSVQPLLDHGATVLRPAGGDIRWHVLADPEDNEFCVFVQ